MELKGVSQVFQRVSGGFKAISEGLRRLSNVLQKDDMGVSEAFQGVQDISRHFKGLRKFPGI